MISFIGALIRNRFTFFPDNFTGKDPGELAPYIKRVTIPTSDGQLLEALLYEQQNVLKHDAKALTIYYHGNAGNLYDRMLWVSKLFGMGQNVLLVSYRGYSKSSGKPSEKGIYIDGQSTLDFAIKSLGFEKSNITLFGRSLGSTVAIHTAQHQILRGVILISPLSSGKAMSSALGLGYLKIFAGKSFHSISKITSLRSKVLIIHGDKDQVVPVQMGVDLFGACSKPKKLVIIKNATHNNLQDVLPDQFWTSIKSFYKKKAF